jgi:hypothetical protein
MQMESTTITTPYAEGDTRALISVDCMNGCLRQEAQELRTASAILDLAAEKLRGTGVGAELVALAAAMVRDTHSAILQTAQEIDDSLTLAPDLEKRLAS